MSISAVILTKNEERNIERCLLSVAWCDEIVVVDDYSEDQTLQLIKNLKIKNKSNNEKLKIYRRELNGDFAGQRNFGLEKAVGDWVLFVDADEIISDKLASEIKSQISNLKSQNQNLKLRTNKINGYYIKRRDYFGGKWLKYGETANVKLLRLARNGSGKWEGRVHEVWKVNGEIKELGNPILHYPHPTVSEFLEEINWYTDLVAQYWKEQGRKMAVWEILLYPAGKFIQNYVLRCGFLDGTAGFIMAAFMSFHSFSARSKYWLGNR